VELPLDPAQTLEDVQALHRALVTCGHRSKPSIGPETPFRCERGAGYGGSAKATKITLASVMCRWEKSRCGHRALTCPTHHSCGRSASSLSIVARKNFTGLQHCSTKICRRPPSDAAAFLQFTFLTAAGMDISFTPRITPWKRSHRCCDNARTIGSGKPRSTARALSCRICTGGTVALIGWEVSSPVTGNGVGGRNSAFVLACAEKSQERKLPCSVGTDGFDGNSPALERWRTERH